jgi:hypothetical protein
MASKKEELAIERAHAFLAAKMQERDLADGKIPPNHDEFVENTTANAKLHFYHAEPEVKAQIINDANEPAGMAWLRTHKDMMRRLKTTASAPKQKTVAVAAPRLTAEEARAATEARFKKEKRDAKRSKIPNEVDVRWKDLKKTDGPVDGPN